LTMGVPAFISGQPRLGRVVNYEADRGIGLVRETIGRPAGAPSRLDEAPAAGEAVGRTYRFHCTAIADGSRMIANGAAVAFVLVPGLAGELEGRHLTALHSATTVTPTLGPAPATSSLSPKLWRRPGRD